YSVNVQVSSNADQIRCDIQDPLLGTEMVFSLPVDRAGRGLWLFENPAGGFNVAPKDETPFVASEHFATRFGLPGEGKETHNRIAVENRNHLVEIRDSFLETLKQADSRAVESMLVDMHTLTLEVMGRPTNLFMGFVSYQGPEAKEGIHCSFDGTPRGAECDGSGREILYIQIEDVTFASFHHLFLCRTHRTRSWKTTLNLFENQQNCALVENDER